MFDAAGLRTRAQVVHVAVDEEVANDLDAALRWAASRIEELERVVEAARHARAAAWLGGDRQLDVALAELDSTPDTASSGRSESGQ